MKHTMARSRVWLCLALMAAELLSSCNMMTEDMDDCPMGLYLSFKYDYNLERADMFSYHVGAVDVYVFDENGKFVTMQSAANAGADRPLADPLYAMKMELQPGRYKLIVLGGQKSYAEQMAGHGARFVRTDMSPGDDITSLRVELETVKQATADGDVLLVDNRGLALDTLWHGMEVIPVEVPDGEPAYHTVSLVRDTKKISVTLRDIDEPDMMDLGDYDMMIVDRNARLLWDNSVDRDGMPVVYTPMAQWVTFDRIDSEEAQTKAGGDDAEPVAGKILHADFMTSRIIYNEKMADDGILTVTNREAGREIIRVDLPDLLSRLRNYENTLRYSRQEFLDRGYDYQLDFFLKGGRLAFVNIRISVLDWNVRVQFAEL